MIKHKEEEAKVKAIRQETRELKKNYEKTEDDLKALQSVGQIIGEVLKQLPDSKDGARFIVKASSGPRYVVGCRRKVDPAKLKPGSRVTLDMTTLTIMRLLPREVDPQVFHMLSEKAAGVSYNEIGGHGNKQTNKQTKHTQKHKPAAHIFPSTTARCIILSRSQGPNAHNCVALEIYFSPVHTAGCRTKSASCAR